jgi:polyisoprenoid-binding protein YceI
MIVTFGRKYILYLIIPFLYFLLFIQDTFGQLHPVADGSSIKFTIHNFGFKTGGKLDAPQGDIVFNPADLTHSSFQVNIKSSSINTDNDSRDEHLKETEYFDVKNYPLIRFVSSSIHTSGGKNSYVVLGTLTIKNISRAITIPFLAEINGNSWVFTGHFTMNRRDFNVGGSSTLSNELTVDIKVLAR